MAFDASRAKSRAVFLLFFLSGATALVYEVVWMRMLAVSLGATAPAIAAVLAAFMAGLALGSWLGGRAVDRWGRPLVFYAACELFIGGYVLLFPHLYGASDVAYRLFYDLSAPALRHSLRFALAGALLLAPTAAMGATAPAVVAALKDLGGGTSRSFSGAYAANTAGAAAGVLVGGVWLLWFAGARWTLVGGAAVNAAIAAAAFALARPIARGPRPSGEVGGGGTLAKTPRRAAAAAFVAGAVALAAQVCWARALSNVVGSASYAFTAMLAVILVAIGGAAAVHRRLPARVAGARWFYAGTCIIAAASLAVSVFVLRNAPGLFLLGYGAAGGGFGVALVLVFLISAAVLFVPSLAVGMVLPIVVAAAHGVRPGRRVGSLYAANTVGAIVGSLGGTFLLLPSLGPIGGLRLAAAALAGGAVLLGVNRRRFLFGVAPATAAAVLAFVTPGPSRHTLALGAGISPSYYLDAQGRPDFGDVAHEKLLFYAESVDASVAVVQYGEVRSLKINGKTVASTNYDDVRVETMLGELPARARPAADAALVIGLGTGITLRAVAAHAPAAQVVCVEINPAVPAAARFFEDRGGGLPASRRITLSREDGRAYVLHTAAKYDIITSDPIHPWTKGSSSLFTVEHFKNCRAILAPGGVMAQWLPLYQLAPQDYLTVVRSFSDAFPYVGLWYTGRDTVLLGAAQPLPALPTYRPYLVARDGALRRLARRAPPNTEDKLILEYTAPRSLYEETEAANLTVLCGLRAAGGDDPYQAITALMDGRRRYLLGDERGAATAYKRGLARWPANRELRQSLADIYFERGLALAAEGKANAAEGMFAAVLRLTPADAAARKNLALLRGRARAR